MTREQPPNVPLCFQERALLIQAFGIWKIEQGKPLNSKVHPEKEELRKIALAHGLKPLFCVDCQYCVKGKGNIWFKLRSNQFF